MDGFVHSAGDTSNGKLATGSLRGGEIQLSRLYAMRILLLIDSYEEGGSRTILHRLCQRWAPMRELQLSVLAFGPEGPLIEAFRGLGINTLSVPSDNCRTRRRVRDLGRKFLYRADRPDIVHSHCAWPDINARVFHDGHPNVPLLTTIYDNRRYQEATLYETVCWRLKERQTRPNAAAFVFASECARHAIEGFKLPDEKCHLIQPGADAIQIFPLSGRNKERYRALVGIGNDVPLLFSSSRLVGSEGHADLIDAMPAILQRHPTTVLLISGDGPERDNLEAKVRTMGLQKSVKIVGRLSELTTKLYSTADIVLHPVKVDRCAIQVPEAQAAGTPIIASSIGSTAELMRDGVTGLLVRPGDPADIARATLELLDDPARRFEMGTAARTFAMEFLEMSSSADKYINLWRQLAPEAAWKSTDSFEVEKVGA